MYTVPYYIVFPSCGLRYVCVSIVSRQKALARPVCRLSSDGKKNHEARESCRESVVSFLNNSKQTVITGLRFFFSRFGSADDSVSLAIFVPDYLAASLVILLV